MELRIRIMKIPHLLIDSDGVGSISNHAASVKLILVLVLLIKNASFHACKIHIIFLMIDFTIHAVSIKNMCCEYR